MVNDTLVTHQRNLGTVVETLGYVLKNQTLDPHVTVDLDGGCLSHRLLVTVHVGNGYVSAGHSLGKPDDRVGFHTPVVNTLPIIIVNAVNKQQSVRKALLVFNILFLLVKIFA